MHYMNWFKDPDMIKLCWKYRGEYFNKSAEKPYHVWNLQSQYTYE